MESSESKKNKSSQSKRNWRAINTALIRRGNLAVCVDDKTGVDATGFKVVGKGQWNQSKHGSSGRKISITMHVSVDTDPVDNS